MKRTIKIFTALIAVLCALLCFSACSNPKYEPVGQLSSEQTAQIHDAYLNEISDEEVGVEIISHIATFGESIVVKTKLTGVAVPCVIVEVKANGIYICSLPDPSYDIIVYRNGEIFKSLQLAYDGGALTYANLLTLKSLLK